jgi:hypothetical protein
MHEYELKGLLIGLFLVVLMGIGIEIAKCGGVKIFFQDIINWIKKGMS